MGIIFSRVKNLSEAHGFPPGARPYVNQEVIDIAGAISRQEYTPVGAVTEYRASAELGKAFSGKRPLKQLVDWGPEMGLLESGDSVVFVDNHDNQRGHSPTAPDILTYKTPRQYEAATAFMLAHPFGATTCVMSSYDFYDENIGPPFDDNFNIISPSILPNGRCGNGWVCEHRWMTMYMMTDFRRQVFGKALRSWWDNGKNQIAFCRGKKGFVVFNLDDTDLSETLDVCLPAGTYCDILSGGKVGNACVGRTIVVSSNNDAMIQIPTNSSQPIIAIHDGPLSKLS